MRSAARLTALVLAAPLALGCSRCGGKSETAGNQAAPETSGIAAVPFTDSVLSFLRPKGEACEWVRADPVSKKQVTVASLPASCDAGRVAFSRDGKRGTVWLYVPGPKPTEGDEDQDTRQSKLWEVALAAGSVRPLPDVDRAAGALLDVGYDEAGTLYALTLQVPPDTEEPPTSLSYGGQTYALDTEGEGLPALAHAFALDPSGTWKHVEAKPTSTGWDYAAETDALDVAKTLGLRSQKLLDTAPDGEKVEDDALLTKLQQAAPDTDPEGEWLKLAGTAKPVYVWEMQGEFVEPTNRLVVGEGEQLQPLPSLTSPSPEAASVQVRGAYLLVSNPMGEDAKLYDLRKIALVGTEEKAVGTTFWPAPATVPVAPQKKEPPR